MNLLSPQIRVDGHTNKLVMALASFAFSFLEHRYLLNRYFKGENTAWKQG
jgi:hypothetical protein